jgi:hypothetical protein
VTTCVAPVAHVVEARGTSMRRPNAVAAAAFGRSAPTVLFQQSTLHVAVVYTHMAITQTHTHICDSITRGGKHGRLTQCHCGAVYIMMRHNEPCLCIGTADQVVPCTLLAPIRRQTPPYETPHGVTILACTARPLAQPNKKRQHWLLTARILTALGRQCADGACAIMHSRPKTSSIASTHGRTMRGQRRCGDTGGRLALQSAAWRQAARSPPSGVVPSHMWR